MASTVFVGNIPYDATEEQLVQICEEVGPVVKFRLVLDRETGKAKGYGFCEYKDEETALSARRNLQGYEINGRQLRVDFAENDKGADRNREQGRGGPGFTSSTDAQKQLPGPPVLGDSAAHQPIGLPLTASAASVMAGTLGRAQTSSLIQNGLQNLGNDPLTHYLAKMSRQQLNEVMSELKGLVLQNKVLARQLLQGSPQLPKALFQAQIMLGMVTPQMMQLANARQSASSAPQPSLQAGITNQIPLLPSHLGQTFSQKEAPAGSLPRPPESQVPNALQNSVTLQQSALPLQHAPVQPPAQQPLLLQPQHLQGTIPSMSGVPIHPQSFGSLSNQPQVPPLPSSRGLISQAQPPLLQHPRPTGAMNVGHHSQPPVPDGSLQQSYFPHPLTSQSGTSSYPVLPNGLETHSRETRTPAAVGNDLTWGSRFGARSSSDVGSREQTGIAGELSEPINHNPKRQKLEDGGGAHLMMNNNISTIGSASAQTTGTGSAPGSQIPNADGMQQSEKQMPQLPSDVESVLLQQVMNLTPEQLSSLPPEQQQQVLQLQQMLR